MAEPRPKKMRILHVATHHGVFRGGAVQACRIASALAARGHKVTLIYHRQGKVEDPELRKTWLNRIDPRVKLVALKLHDPKDRNRLKWRIILNRFQVVHVHRDDALRTVARIAEKLKSFVFVAQRGTTSPPHVGRVHKTFRSPRLGAAVAVAEAVKKILVENEAPSGKVHVVYGSVDPKQFEPGPRDESLRAECGFTPEQVVIGSLSAFRKAKGFDVLLDAARQAAGRDARIRFLFIGKDVDTRVASMAADMGIADKCFFAGHRSDIPRWLRAMDCSVVCARGREGLSGVLRESLACGIPVISTDTDGNGEIVRHGETGLLVPIDDPAKMADAFVCAATNPGYMKEMAEKGRQWVLQHCTPEVQATQLEKIYRDCLK